MGNKKDLSVAGERQVEYANACGFAQENECLLFETSALTGENIDNALDILVQNILNKMDSGLIPDDDYSIRKQVTSMSSANQNLTNQDKD